MSMGKEGMWEHSEHAGMGHMKGPPNTLPMMGGMGPFGAIDMGGMFTVVKVRDSLGANDYSDPGWYDNPKGTVAHRVSRKGPGLRRPTAAAGRANHLMPEDASGRDAADTGEKLWEQGGGMAMAELRGRSGHAALGCAGAGLR